MSESSDLPSLWTHEPHIHLEFQPGDKVADIDTNATPGFKGSKSRRPELQAERNERFAELQEMLYANSRSGDTRSILLVLQGMDTAGKGGIVKHVVGAGNPQGIRYTSFGEPTEEERAHHYLWRIRNALPTGGHIGVFDRSHYEDVLIVRVHNLVPPEVWGARYDEINAFEKELVDGGTTIVKVAMFVSLDEQKQRLAEAPRAPGQVLEVQPGRHRRARAVAEVPGGLPGGAGQDVDRLRAVARGAVRPQVVQPAGHHRTADRGAEVAELVLAASRFRCRGGEDRSSPRRNHQVFAKS